MQDIANQDTVVQSLTNLFDHTTVVDRRGKPSHGYRAVHVIVNHGGKMIEVQVRTALQHLWAELSEKFSDVVDPAIKYGVGDQSIQSFLTAKTSLVARKELWEAQFTDFTAQLTSQDITDDERAKTLYLQELHNVLTQELSEHLRDIIERIEEYQRKKDDIPN